MNGFKQTTLTGYQTVQAHLSTMAETTDMLPVAMSVDSDFFSRIYDVAFGEKGNKDREVAMREEQIIAAQRQEDDQDMLREVAETAIKEMREQQAAMISMYGYDVSEEALNAAILYNLQNWDEISKDMSPEQSKELYDLSVEARDASGEEKKRILEEIDAKASDYGRSTFERAKNIDDGRLEAKLESEAQEVSVDRKEELKDQLSQENNFDKSFGGENSQIAENFTLEAEGVGTHAQYMTLSEESFDITATEHSVAHQGLDDNAFVLDTLG